jgi:hypothetical protein
MFDLELAVGDRMGRGEAGGELGSPLLAEVEKNGNGARDTSSSSVWGAAEGEPREETDDIVGLETLVDTVAKVNPCDYGIIFHTSVRERD